MKTTKTAPFARLFALLLIVASLFALPVASSFAAEVVPTAPDSVAVQAQIEEQVNALSEKVKTLAKPVAGFAMLLIALSFILAPAFKEWAMENKRVMSTVIFGVVLIGFSGELIELFFE